jgi:hypothetical protein
MINSKLKIIHMSNENIKIYKITCLIRKITE